MSRILFIVALGTLPEVLAKNKIADDLVHARGRCVSYGLSSHYRLYNVYNGEPQYITDPTATENMMKVCPMFYNQAVCCDAAQINIFAERIKMAATLLEHCGSCWANFRTLLCQQLCSPDQSSFMEVLEMFTPSEAGSNLTARSFRTSLTREFAAKLFDSCKDVTAFGVDVITLVCDDVECSDMLLLKELGDNTSRADFYTDYHVGSRRGVEITPLKVDSLTHCWESSHEGAPPCACEDCTGSCTMHDVKQHILGMDSYEIAAILGGISGGITVVTYALVKLIL